VGYDEDEDAQRAMRVFAGTLVALLTAAMGGAALAIFSFLNTPIGG
jgi:hypothetical protein